jgi:hypothetical protein
MHGRGNGDSLERMNALLVLALATCQSLSSLFGKDRHKWKGVHRGRKLPQDHIVFAVRALDQFITLRYFIALRLSLC